MSTPIASLSLDLDNKWSYLRTHGHAGWEDYPSYLGVVVPRVLDLFARFDLRATIFVVGKDATIDQNIPALAALADAGHELGNHSFHHEPWLHRFSRQELDEEIASAEVAIEMATGQLPVGFRGPGFSTTDAVFELLAQRGYLYDATTFPTFLGPLAKLYCLLKSCRLDERQRSERSQLFGSLRSGFRTLQPHIVSTRAGEIVEIPVTTMPLARVPIHMTYLHYLGQFSMPLAKAYLTGALALCHLRRVPPSMLLHPLDFLGAEDEPELAFFPGMKSPREAKLALVDWTIAKLAGRYRLVTLAEQAAAIRSQVGLPATIDGPTGVREEIAEAR